VINVKMSKFRLLELSIFFDLTKRKFEETIVIRNNPEGYLQFSFVFKNGVKLFFLISKYVKKNSEFLRFVKILSKLQ
jgi:hypothetical protein